MSTVGLMYYNGTALVQRDLLEANQCPKCGTLGCVALADIAYKAPSHGKAEAIWASVLTPVRCSLCPTEYARRFDAGERVEEACETARNNLAEVDARRKAKADPDAYECRIVHDGEVWRDWPETRRERALQSALGLVPRRTLRERLVAAWRAWRGA